MRGTIGIAAFVTTLSLGCYGSTRSGADGAGDLPDESPDIAGDRVDAPDVQPEVDEDTDVDAAPILDGGDAEANDGWDWPATGCFAERDPPACAGADCATSEQAAHLLDLWWQAMFETLDAPEELIRSTLEVVQATIVVGDPSIFFRVDFYVRVGWVRTGQSTTVNLGVGPLDPLPDDATVMHRLLTISGIGCSHLPRTAIGREEVAELALSCSPAVNLESCGIRALDRPYCDFTARFFSAIDEVANRCLDTQVEVERGMLLRCVEAPCWVE